MLQKRKDCPDCGNPLGLKATKCPCGWKAPIAPGTLAAPVDPYRLCCEWTANSLRCRYLGSRSDSTTGNGPWYCSQHINCHDAVIGAEIVEESHRNIVEVDYSYDARRKAFLDRPALPRSEATPVRNIREAYQRSAAFRQRNPGHIGAHADRIATRVPGQDDEERAA